MKGFEVESKDTEGAVQSQAVQLKNLKENRIKGDRYQTKIPCFNKLIYVLASNKGGQLIITNIGNPVTVKQMHQNNMKAQQKC